SKLSVRQQNPGRVSRYFLLYFQRCQERSIFTFEVVMKKIACLSALACVLAVSAGSAMAQSTVTGGYAQSDYQGVA
ncbi:hypothetical protein, partial [Bacillus licheniformis]|uniref:hypothetical protein n=1 Tax=Bacillus licheniformis TaxID=1402 RepID=UPI0030CA3EB2